ncbi:MAG: ABC transporter substrate-binding protein, partial [Thermodesulfobacteriota bacterium]|nr:ABC transporter substrate-binding protein [Thermodesulfobacteriota bacterium]
MKRVKAMMGFLIFFILGVSIVASEAADIQAFTDREIKLGLIMAMSGPMAPSGAAMNLSIKDYLRHVNEEGGIHGRKIKLIIEDGQFKIPKAMAAYNKLWFREKIFTLLGCLGCGQNVALFPQFKEHNIVTIPLSSCKEF